MSILSLLVFVFYLICTPEVLEYAIRDIRGLRGNTMFSGLDGLVVIMYGVVSVIAAIPYAILGYLTAHQCRNLPPSYAPPKLKGKLVAFILSNILLYMATILPIVFVNSGTMLLVVVTLIVIFEIVINALFFMGPDFKVSWKGIRNALLVLSTIDIVSSLALIGFVFIH